MLNSSLAFLKFIETASAFYLVYSAIVLYCVLMQVQPETINSEITDVPKQPQEAEKISMMATPYSSLLPQYQHLSRFLILRQISRDKLPRDH
jgi:hypothetical protein